jgi:hypothetical protein
MIKPAPVKAVNIFGEPIILQAERGKHYVQPRGYADRPGTGPAGEACGTCRHAHRFKQSKSWIKCELNRGKWSGGRATDILAGSPACSKWEAA